MAGYKGHLMGGAAAAALFCGGLVCLAPGAIAPRDFVLLAFTGLVGALFPDIDTNSRAQDLFYACFLVLDIALIGLGRYRAAAFVGLLAILPILGKHRGWTHTWWALLLVPLPIFLIPLTFLGMDVGRLWPFYGVAVSGYASHLLLDQRWR